MVGETEAQPDDPANGGHGDVAVRVFKPSDPLQGYVTFYYVVEVAGPLTDFLYPEWGNVRFALQGEWIVRMPGFYSPAPQTAALFGPTDRHGAISTSGGKVVGFGLTPIGWRRLVAEAAGAMADRVAPLEHRMGFDGEAMRRDLIADVSDAARIARLECALLQRLAAQPPVSLVVLAADRALRTQPARVSDFAAATGVTVRTLERLCLHTFGFTPKRVMRLQRFLDTLGRVRAAVGQPIDAGMSEDYCDQSHFYRDFKDFMAMTPRQYFGAPRRLMAAAAEAQVRAGVTLSFRLPPQPGEEGAQA